MLKRIFIYLKEMYPPMSIVGTFLLSVVIQLVLYRLEILDPDFVVLITSGISLNCFSLLLRVMDEFKDEKDDLINFPKRPLPSGRVLKKDLLVLGWTSVILPLILNFGKTFPFYLTLIILLYSFLMLKWFFIEDQMRKSLPLAFLSHHPIVFFHFIYLALNISSGKIHWEVLPLALMLTNWEFSRKLRASQDETAYTTYSKILGPKIAALIALITQIIFLACGSFLIHKLQPNPFYLFLLTPSVLISIYYIIFIFKPVKTYSFKKFSEYQILNMVIALFVASMGDMIVFFIIWSGVKRI
jgi:4-hydroxybenzoate polyprenyltransferase